ncbi:MAG: TMEM175 family protein [Deinococcales bacterium]
MNKARVEAFSDGVIAIIVTIMVIELKAPHEPTIKALLELLPIGLSYVLSFLVISIMWVNHHALLAKANRADVRVLWANINLLFWISLIPFVTAYMGENYAAPLTVSVYGLVLAIASISFTPLRLAIAAQHPKHKEKQQQHQQVLRKNSIAPILYLAGAMLANVSIWISFAMFVLVPIIYFLPERHTED